MKVIAIFDWITSPISTAKGNIKEGNIYTVKSEQSGYSTFGKRWVEAYEFYETEGLFEKGIFIPLSSVDEAEIYNVKLKNDMQCGVGEKNRN